MPTNRTFSFNEAEFFQKWMKEKSYLWPLSSREQDDMVAEFYKEHMEMITPPPSGDGLLPELPGAIKDFCRDLDPRRAEDLCAYIREYARQALLQSAQVGGGDVGNVIDAMERDAADIRLGRQWMSACEHYAKQLRRLAQPQREGVAVAFLLTSKDDEEVQELSFNPPGTNTDWWDGNWNAQPLYTQQPASAAVCETCDGAGQVQMSYTVARCCGRGTPSGDCCGNPEPELQVETEHCPDCNQQADKAGERRG